MIPTQSTRADMHCHSTASELAKLGIQRSVGLPECATPPEEVYELAKRRGMDFVTITDHDTIDGCLDLADRDDCFISEELTAHFAGEPQAVHVLCYGITPADHEYLQANAADLEVCATYLRHIREGRAEACGDQGGAAKWAHSALALATRAFFDARPAANPDTPGREAEEVAGSDWGAGSPDPGSVLAIAERVVADGAERGGGASPSLGAREARAILRAWLDSVDLGSDPRELMAMMQADGFSHVDLARRARRTHERRMRGAIASLASAVERGDGYAEAATALFGACVPAIPYIPATTILGQEMAKLATRDGEPGRVALVVDGAGGMHGVTHTMERIREHGVPGWEVEVIGTDPRVDRRLPAVAEVEVPFYAGMTVGIPSVPELVQTLVDGRYDLIHLASPGPAGIGAALSARIGGIPLVGSYHTELAAYAALRSGDPRVELAARAALSLFYRQCQVVLSPSAAADESLAGLGVDPDRVGRWARGVDLQLYDPARRSRARDDGRIRVLYAGRLTKEKGVELLAESYLRASERDPRLHLVLAGGGPEEDLLRVRLGERATFLGWLGREELADAYADADLFLFCSRTDTYGQVIAEAQASGLPVVAVAEGGPLSLIRDRKTGWLCDPEPESLAAAITQLAASEFLRAGLARAGLGAVEGRTWEAAMAQLAAGYARSLRSGVRKPGPAPLQEVA